ncbi:MAG: hypothetical protein ACKVJU_12245 [Verrucomicrobiales bacterium]
MNSSNKKWLSRLSAIALIFVMLGGGLAIWDQYDSSFGGLSASIDPFSDQPEGVSLFIGEIRSKLLDWQMELILKKEVRQNKWFQRKVLPTIDFAGYEW